MKTSQILICISRLLFPFMLLFGFYIIFNGHLSPGGGFQGGAILATAVLITYFFDTEKISNLNLLIKFEKFTFVAILFIAILSLFTKGVPFTNFIISSFNVRKVFLVLLNFLIGLKVASGLITIFSTFAEEGS